MRDCSEVKLCQALNVPLGDTVSSHNKQLRHEGLRNNDLQITHTGVIVPILM